MRWAELQQRRVSSSSIWIFTRPSTAFSLNPLHNTTQDLTQPKKNFHSMTPVNHLQGPLFTHISPTEAQEAQHTSKEAECTVLNLNLSENFKSEKSNSCICILSISLPYRYYDINAIAWLWYLTEFCAHQRWEILSGWVWSHFGVLLPFVALASIALTHILLPTPLPIAPLLIHKLKTKLQRNAEA